MTKTITMKIMSVKCKQACYGFEWEKFYKAVHIGGDDKVNVYNYSGDPIAVPLEHFEDGFHVVHQTETVEIEEEPIKPAPVDVHTPSSELTKLEYAAIHIHAGRLAHHPCPRIDESIREAEALLEQIEGTGE